MTLDNSSIIIRFRYWRRASEGDSLVAVYPGWAPQLIHRNPFRIRRSRRPLPQILYNQHLQASLKSEDSKGLTGFKFLLHLLYFPHLHGPLGCAGNKGFITPLKSTLTKNSLTTPLESALPRTRVVGGNGSFASPNQTRERLTEYGLADLPSPSGAPRISTGNLC